MDFFQYVKNILYIREYSLHTLTIGCRLPLGIGGNNGIKKICKS